MRALIFAAGIGSRLKPFTDSHPKALAPVDGVPMLGRVLCKLRAAGVDTVVVNVHHFADQIEDYLRECGGMGMEVHVSDERSCLLDTGGGMLRARRWLEDGGPFIVHNADILCSDDVASMYRRHLESGADVSLLAMERVSSRHLYFAPATGRLLGWGDDRNGAVRPEGFRPSADMLRLSFGGVHVVAPSVFPALEEYAARVGQVFSIVPFYTEYCRELSIRASAPEPGSVWFDVGRPESLAAASEFVARHPGVFPNPSNKL